jgi:transcription antitermination factor NusG
MKTSSGAAVQRVTDGAVGMPTRRWFIAIVNHNSEKKCGEQLQRLGYETYVPTQTEKRITPQGRRRTVERVVLSSLVFLRATEPERKEVVKLPYILRFMTNRAGKVDAFTRHPLATVPADQIERLKFMLYNTDDPVSIESMPIHLGDKVRVIRGGLQGLEGYVIRCEEGQSYIGVQLDVIGCAKVKINLLDTERM